MNAVLKKLGLINQTPVLILNAPDEYKAVMNDISGEIHNEIKGKYEFIQIFAVNFKDAQSIAADLINALKDDGHLWLCYPKGASKKYKSDINRTKSWEIFAPYDFEPVSQVAIDDDWSGMRFRHVDKIKSMARKTAATDKGKERIKDNK